MSRYLSRYATFVPEHEVIAVFGQAKLVRQPSDRLEVLGGSDLEREAAKQWVADFLTPMPGSRRNAGR